MIDYFILDQWDNLINTLIINKENISIVKRKKDSFFSVKIQTFDDNDIELGCYPTQRYAENVKDTFLDWITNRSFDKTRIFKMPPQDFTIISQLNESISAYSVSRIEILDLDDLYGVGKDFGEGSPRADNEKFELCAYLYDDSHNESKDFLLGYFSEKYKAYNELERLYKWLSESSDNRSLTFQITENNSINDF